MAKMKVPLVSVIMVTYNHEKFIAEAIEGVLMQEIDFDIELLISNDASNDSTDEIVNSFVNNHPKGELIKYFKHSNNKGMMSNFFWAIEQCRGKYIALCDGDDFWISSKKLKIQFEFLENNHKYSLCFHDCIVVDLKGSVLKKSRLPSSSKRNLTSFGIKKGSLIPTGTILFRRINLPLEFPKNLEHAYNGDYILFYYLSFKGDAYFHINSIFSAYRVHNNGVWSSLSKSVKYSRHLNTFFLLARNFKFRKKITLYRNISNTFYELAKEYGTENNKVIRNLFLKSILYSIFSFNLKILIFSIIKFFKYL